MTNSNETLQQRLARQMAENHPGCAVRVGSASAPAQGEGWGGTRSER
ncbi:hypothetical protein QUC32_22950 [Novosphingobium resinovorum]|nr:MULTISPECIES: hypothetical protein [Novosphingobium]MBF7012509.1 hypothetical protein [Novosphingobium sp. HR1a]WJM27244.1 hypothetical protein QUC32_22950 [Novosphingobium resinovorum]